MRDYNYRKMDEEYNSDKSTSYSSQNSSYIGNNIGRKVVSGLFTLTLCGGTVLGNGGANEPGFVSPPEDRKLPPPPPRTISSSESCWGCCCCCPPCAVSKSEAKKPPTPPVSIVKLKH